MHEILSSPQTAPLCYDHKARTEVPKPAVPTQERDAIVSEMMEVDDEFLGV